jgi:hypothetical protein
MHLRNIVSYKEIKAPISMERDVTTRENDLNGAVEEVSEEVIVKYSLKKITFWDVIPCSLVEVYRRHGEM